MAESLAKAVSDKTLQDALALVLERALPDSGERRAVAERLSQLIEDEVRLERSQKDALRHEAERTQSILQNALEGVIMVDDEGKILMMNPVAEDITGTRLVEAAGKPLSEKLPLRPASAGALVKDEEGNVVGVVGAPVDAVKLREMQERQKEFIAHVAHELRAPLSSIKASLEIFIQEKAGRLEEGENRLLSTALKNSDKLAGLISDILDYSKIESGQMTVYPKEADSRAILREAVDSLQPWAGKKRLTLSLRAAVGLPSVRADHRRTVQILVNLISNAIKFTPVGGQITVSAELEPSAGAGEGGFVRFCVSDTGPGIPKGEQERIFEKFVQLSAGQAYSQGIGLGLAISRALVRLQGGTLWLESEPGRGASFFFTIPLYAPGSGGAASAGRRPWWKRLFGLS